MPMSNALGLALHKAPLGGVTPYWKRVNSYGPIAYWPLWEASGLIVQCLVDSPAQDGAYSSDVSTWPVVDGIGDGNTSPNFDGTNDFIDAYSVALNTAFPKAEGTLHTWVRMDAGTWVDATNYFWIYFKMDANNQIRFNKQGANTARLRYHAVGASIDVTIDGGLATLDYFSLTLTWSVANNEIRGYINGIQSGAPQASPGALVGNLDFNETLIGAFDQAPTLPQNGGMAHTILFDYPMTPAEVLDISSVRGGG